MLLNLSNHPSGSWPTNQKMMAIEKYQSITDLPFPPINPNWGIAEVLDLAADYVQKVRGIDPNAIHIMGELTFTINLVNQLKAIGYNCVASTTERIATIDEFGNKNSSFQFVQFRPY